jgi:outer membrane protein with beta-barrel domain
MRKSIALFSTLAGLLVALALTPVAKADPAGSVDFFAGQKELDRNFTESNNMEEQDALALFTDWGSSNSQWRLAVDVLAGSKDVNDDALNVKLDGSTGEIGAGARWYPMKESHWMPHLGAGLALVSGKVETNQPGPGSVDLAFDDSKLGYWTDGGIAYRFGEHFKLGGRIRYSDAKLEIKDNFDNVREVNAGGLSYGVTAGATW